MKSMDKKAIMVFGVGILQKSIINRAKKMGLYVVGIDPCEDAYSKNDVDAFEVVGGQDYDRTLEVAKKYNVCAIITSATDKPLLMMAKIADVLNLPCFSVSAARYATDKFLMKQQFILGDVPCARGKLIKTIDEAYDLCFPVIVKPRDNSGSRGVILCYNKEELQKAMEESYQYTHLDSLLVEEFIEGQAYSIEGFHYNRKSEVYQFTEKRCTPFPYTAELGHKQPAILTEEQKDKIRDIISRIGECLDFDNCPSHTELKINKRGIFVLETSPRLAGDYNASILVPLSTRINIEDQLLCISLGQQPNIHFGRLDKASAICWICLPEGIIEDIDHRLYDVPQWPHIKSFDFTLQKGDKVNKITNSLNRYGHFIVQADTREEVDIVMDDYERKINSFFKIK